MLDKLEAHAFLTDMLIAMSGVASKKVYEAMVAILRRSAFHAPNDF